MQDSSSSHRATSLGHEYSFLLAADTETGQYRAIAMLGYRPRIVGLGQTRESATMDMLNKVRASIEARRTS